MATRLYVVMQHRGGGNLSPTLIGVFSSDTVAQAACLDHTYFIRDINQDENLTNSSNWAIEIPSTK